MKRILKMSLATTPNSIRPYIKFIQPQGSIDSIMSVSSANVISQVDDFDTDMDDGFDMTLYLSLTGAPSDIDVNAADLNLLNSLVYRHVSSIHYQNYDLLTGKEILDMTPNGLLRRLLVNARGGMCYETSELMFFVLAKFGFDVRRVAVSVLNNKPYNPADPLVHNILIVNLNQRMYIVDVGFGYNSVRLPLDFDFDKTEEKNVIEGETYQLIVGEDYFQLNILLKGEYSSLFRFPRPFEYIDYEQSLAYYRDLVTYPLTSPIRDSVVFFGAIVDEGRHCFSCDYDEKGASNFNFLTVLNGVVKKTNLDVKEFARLVKKYVEFSIKYENDGGRILFLKTY